MLNFVEGEFHIKLKYNRAIKKIAKQEGINPEIVYVEMQKAIEAGYNNPDPIIQANWKKIAPDDMLPSPEKLIELLSREIKNAKK